MPPLTTLNDFEFRRGPDRLLIFLFETATNLQLPQNRSLFFNETGMLSFWSKVAQGSAETSADRIMKWIRQLVDNIGMEEEGGMNKVDLLLTLMGVISFRMQRRVLGDERMEKEIYKLTTIMCGSIGLMHTITELPSALTDPSILPYQFVLQITSALSVDPLHVPTFQSLLSLVYKLAPLHSDPFKLVKFFRYLRLEHLLPFLDHLSQWIGVEEDVDEQDWIEERDALLLHLVTSRHPAVLGEMVASDDDWTVLAKGIFDEAFRTHSFPLLLRSFTRLALNIPITFFYLDTDDDEETILLGVDDFGCLTVDLTDLSRYYLCPASQITTVKLVVQEDQTNIVVYWEEGEDEYALYKLDVGYEPVGDVWVKMQRRWGSRCLKESLVDAGFPSFDEFTEVLGLEEGDEETWEPL